MARRLVQRHAAEEAYDRICETPEVGVLRSYDSRRLRSVRVWPVPGFRRFLVFYRVTPKIVEVIRVLHSARDIPRVLRRGRGTAKAP